MSSRAWMVDEIHSVGEKTALCDHLEELIDDYPEVGEVLQNVLNLRRKQMQHIADQNENSNPKFWCAFKHAVKAFTLDSEVYEAVMDEETKQNMIESSDILASLISLFLGMDFETCARCIYDRLLLNQVQEGNRESRDNENSDQRSS